MNRVILGLIPSTESICAKGTIDVTFIEDATAQYGVVYNALLTEKEEAEVREAIAKNSVVNGVIPRVVQKVIPLDLETFKRYGGWVGAKSIVVADIPVVFVDELSTPPKCVPVKMDDGRLLTYLGTLR